MKIQLSITRPQQEIITDPARIKVLAAGRRWGKSVLTAYYMFIVSIQRPGARIWFIGQSYRKAISQMRMMQKNIQFMSFVKHMYTQFPPRFEMQNGSLIEFLSADGNVQNMLGEGLVLAVIDEATVIDRKVFEEIILPMISDTRGTVFLCSTVSSRNWFWSMVERGQAPNNTQLKSWIYKSETGIAFQSERGKADLELVRRNIPPAIFEREYCCTPLSGTDSVFNWVDRVIGGEPCWTPIEGMSYGIGLDVGKTKDNTAITVLECESGRIVHFEILPLKQEHVTMAKRVREIQIRYNNCPVIIDCTGGMNPGRSESYVRFYKAVIPNLREFYWNRQNKQNIINHLALEIEQAKFKIPVVYSELINQLRVYQYYIGEHSLYPQYGAPRGEKDDGVASLAQVIWGRDSGWLGGNMNAFMAG